MIYNLKELRGHLDNTEWRNDSEKAETIALMIFGIAERLEALVDIEGRLCEIQQKVLWQIEGDK